MPVDLEALAEKLRADGCHVEFPMCQGRHVRSDNGRMQISVNGIGTTVTEDGDVIAYGRVDHETIAIISRHLTDQGGRE